MARLVPNDAFRRLCRTKDYIHVAYAEPQTVASLAKRTGMSVFHFVREFSRAFGETPHAYLRQVRINKAKELLRTDYTSVTEVCLAVGFSSLGSFSTVFAKTTGQAPVVYRRAMGKIFQIPLLYQKTLIPHCFLNFFDPSH